MENLKIMMISVFLWCALALTGCSKSESTGTQATGIHDTNVTQVVSPKPIVVTENKESSAIGSGLKTMQSVLGKMEEELSSKKVDVLQKEVLELDEAWEKIEDAVKENSKELYEKVEKPIGAIKAGVKVKPLDDIALKRNIQSLGLILKDMEMSESSVHSDKKTMPIHEGVKQMKGFLVEAKEGLKEKNKIKFEKAVKELDETWELFEDGIKAKSKDAYDKVESPLGSIKAGSKIEPFDDKTLSIGLENLSKGLDEIENMN